MTPDLLMKGRGLSLFISANSLYGMRKICLGFMSTALAAGKFSHHPGSPAIFWHRLCSYTDVKRGEPAQNKDLIHTCPPRYQNWHTLCITYG